VNTFALEIFDDQGQVCTFYTVRWEDATLSETDKFFQKFRYDEQLKNSLRELASFLEVVIGDEHGALEYFFRFENAAQALPPSGTYKVQDISIKYGNFPLRLYCLRISEKLVVLFNGGEKQLVQHKAEEQVWYFRKPIFSPNVFWTHYSKKKFTLLLTKELFAITMTVMK